MIEQLKAPKKLSLGHGAVATLTHRQYGYAIEPWNQRILSRAVLGTVDEAGKFVPFNVDHPDNGAEQVKIDGEEYDALASDVESGALSSGQVVEAHQRIRAQAAIATRSAPEPVGGSRPAEAQRPVDDNAPQS